MINDVAIAIRQACRPTALSHKRWSAMQTCTKAMGLRRYLVKDPRACFTLSIHQLNNYPVPKQISDLDINVDDYTEDDEYLELLARGLAEALERFHPDLIFYVAGADPYRQDQLGGLWISMGGLRRRDDLVFAEAAKRKIPIAITLAGGYARNVEDTVNIHVNTILAARDAKGSEFVAQVAD